MEAERDDMRVLLKGASGAGDAAHERAVMTVRLTLLLLIIGVALFLFTGSGGANRVGQERGDAVEHLK
jgi:hypothetical protein